MLAEAPLDEARQRRVGWRIGLCAIAFLTGWVLAMTPTRLLVGHGESLTVYLGRYLAGPMPWVLVRSLGDGTGVLIFLAELMSLTLTMPLHIAMGLALVGPPQLVVRRRDRWIATAILSAPFALGVAAALATLEPTRLASWLRSPLHSTDRYLFPSVNSGNDIVVFAASLTFLVGIALQLPLWPSILVRLNITMLDSICRRRPTVLLIAMLVGAWVMTRSNLVIVDGSHTAATIVVVGASVVLAAMLYLPFEIGLLIARLLPAREE